MCFTGTNLSPVLSHLMSPYGPAFSRPWPGMQEIVSDGRLPRLAKSVSEAKVSAGKTSVTRQG